ncbi:MAG: tetratricopeptide repeat protein [Bacteroidetes bacterium]|nr:tetratricopeptide repeat protein [Bacteroidota bacterium]
MSGGAGGSILSMIISLKNNNALLSKRKSFRDIRRNYKTQLDKRKLAYHEADEQFLKELRLELIRQRKKETIALYIQLSVSLILLFIILAGVLIFIPQSSKTPVQVDQEKITRDSIRSSEFGFKYMLSYGDYRFRSKDYRQAIHEYRQALNIHPEDFYAQFQLARVYAAVCIEQDSLCDVAIQTLHSLVLKYDTSALIRTERANLFMHLGDFDKASVDLDWIRDH